MKILFVSGNLCDGGAQRVISVVTSQLAKKGHEVHLLLFARDEKEYPIDSNVKIASLGESFEEYVKLSLVQRTIAIRKYVKSIQPDAAVGFLEGGYGLFLATLGMRFPKVASARVDPKFILQRKGWRAEIDKLWFRQADAVVVQTNRQKVHAKDAGWHNMTVIVNPVSNAALATEPHDYSRPCQRIVMAGRLAKQKNYPMAFRAMKIVLGKYPDAQLDIFGKGLEETALRNMITELDLQNNVRLLGWTENTVKEYVNSDVYVLASDFEGMPNALMEAMAVGLPCISTDCDTGPEDLITDGENGYLVQVNDAETLAQRLIQIMDMSPEQRKELGENAKMTMKEYFNAEAIVNQWEKLLQELIGA